MLERMVAYAQSGYCRWQVILEYFGDALEGGRCDGCDNCLRPPLPLEVPAARGEAAGRGRQSAGRQVGAGSASVLKAPPPLLPGDSVKVPKYGAGKVVSVTADAVTVVFPDSETRSFVRARVRRAA
jgi:ATP-dependent DNA helicase RecQ